MQLAFSNSIEPYQISLLIILNLIQARYDDGKFSLLNNLPFPKLHTLENHGYISIVDIVKDILAHGLRVDDMKFENPFPNLVKLFSHSARGLKIKKMRY